MANATSTMVVYIVDPDDAGRTALARALDDAGWQSREFRAAEELLVDPEAGPRGCILLDITQPPASGSRLAVELKQRGLALPLIAVSARDDAATRSLAQELGARFFFRKPVDTQGLIDAIQWVVASEGGPTPAI